MTETRRRNWSYVGILIVVLGGVLAAQAFPPKYEIAGIWLFDVDTPRAKGVAEVTFNQEVNKLWGHYSSAAFGENDFTGTLKDRDLTFNFQTDVENPNNGRKLRILVTFTGKAESEASMRGTISVGPWGRGTFTASRKPPK